jgi:hypothetical protein
MDGLPPSVTPQQRDACESTLIADAKRFPIKDLRQRALRITDVFKEPGEAARDEDEALRLRERRAWARTEMWMVNDNDGTLLCSRHHHQAHDQGWQFRQTTDGRPLLAELVGGPPIEIKKPHGIWQRNHRWRP